MLLRRGGSLESPGTSSLGQGYWAGQVLIPALAGLTLEEIYGYVKGKFSGEFTGGATIAANPGGMEIYAGSFAPNIPTLFAAERVANLFCTPVSALVKGQARFLQLAVANADWSLSTGGISNSAVFRIHRTWLDWLLTKDNCNLRYNGHTSYRDCGIQGCPVAITVQKFLEMDDSELELQQIVGQGYSGRTLDLHSRFHTKEYFGCPTVQGDVKECPA
jgi:hypothetical protein